MKGKVSNKVSFSLMLPTVSRKALVPGQSFVITEDQFLSEDIQSALMKGQITFDKTPKLPKTIKITNNSIGSISIGGVGILRAGKSVEARASDVNDFELNRLVSEGKIYLGNKAPVEDSKVEEEVKEAFKEEAKPKKVKKLKKVGEEDEIEILDTSSPAIDGSDDKNSIMWVDEEETERRLENHPMKDKLKKGK
jgi:hypothetical protein